MVYFPTLRIIEMKENQFSVIVIGAGAAGLVVAKGVAQAGKKVLLVEKKNWGGDCTNFGCIPSKTMIHLAKEMHIFRKYGISAPTNHIFSQIDETVQKIRVEEEPKALEKHGIKTLTAEAVFTSPHTIKAGDKEFKGKFFVIATGAKPRTPAIPGLENVPFYTNETIFSLRSPPSSLLIIGGGPIGCELAQAFARMGTEVSLVHKHPHILSREPPEVARVMEAIFQKEGIHLYTNSTPLRCSKNNSLICCELEKEGKEIEVRTEALLLSVGRQPAHTSLQLDKAKVKHTEKSIPIDTCGRTSQKHIFAIGDAAGSPFFTHKSENQARMVLTSLLLPFWKKSFTTQPIPRVTYTNPEIASIGITDENACRNRKNIVIYNLPLAKVDRAITENQTDGLIRIITKKWSSKILGAVIMAPRAGEMIMEISLAMKHKIPLRKIASLIHPYPTYSLGIRQISDQWLTKTILPLFRKKT